MQRLFLFFLVAPWCLTASDLRLSGVVLDPSGASVPTAYVELTGGAETQQVTGQDGTFAFEGLAAADYTLTVSAGGFETERVGLTLDEPIEDMAVTLAIAAESAVVEVAAEAAEAPEPGGNADAVTVRQEDLQALPALDGDVVGALQGLLDEGGALGEGGGLVVDGMETSELGVTPSAIEEVRINKDPYSAEYSRPGRSRIEIITKKSATAYHGQLNLRLRDYRLDARNAFATVRPEQQRRAIEGHLVGPIGNGERNSFLISAEHDRDRQSSIVFAETPEGPVRDVVLTPEVDTEASVRYNRHASYQRSFSLRYEWEKESARNGGVGGFTLPEAASDERETDHDLYWSYRRVAGPTAVYEWRGRVSRERADEVSLLTAPRIVVEDAFTAGGAQRDSRSYETGVESAASASWQLGRQFVRVGLQLRDLTWKRWVDRDNYGGVYRFGSLEDYAAGRPYALTRREGDPEIGLWDVEAAVFFQDNIKLNERSVLALGLRYDRQNLTDDPDNFAPRGSIAYSFGAERKTTVRAGGGIFYDNVSSGAARDLRRFSTLRVREVLLLDPPYPALPDGGEGVSAPPNLVRWAAGLTTPYMAQFGASLERKFEGGPAVSVNWSRSVGVGLLRSRDLNAMSPGDESRPDAELGVVRQLESSARLEADRVSAQLRGKITELFQGTVRYSWGRALDNVAGDDTLPADSLDLSGEWGPAGFDRRHRFDLLGAMEIPHWFQLGMIFRARSGSPYTLTTGVDSNGDGRTAERPAGVSRNTERGPGSANFDVRLSRRFETFALPGSRDEPTSLTLTLDAFNLLNTVNLRNVVGNLRSPLFGQATSASAARRLQAGLRWRF